MRPALLNPFFTEVAALKGVGPVIQRCLARLELTRLIDLVFHLPIGLVERHMCADIASAGEDQRIILEIMVQAHEAGDRRRPLRVRCIDPKGTPLTLVYFHGGGYAARRLPVGARRVISGRVEHYGSGVQIVHPDFVVPPEEAATIPRREPVYALTAGLNNGRMAAAVAHALAHILERSPALPEWIDPATKARESFPDWRDALVRVHSGADGAGNEGTGADMAARMRLAYDELFANQLAVALLRARGEATAGQALRGTGALTQALRARLPYRLTGAQDRVIQEMCADMARSRPMLRLLQGDVGSGKTVTALMALLTAVEAGVQGAFLAPTDVLARQHAARIAEVLGDMPVRTALLTGREKGTARAALLADLAAGKIDILIGTHAIFQDDVVYRDLGLAVIDEQHRFGVQQRLALMNKGHTRPHLLAMTATPIPRTLTLALHGEMDVSQLDEMPPGRRPIDTRVVSMARLDDIVAALGRHVTAGGQAYWVCPAIGESSEDQEQDADIAAAVARAAHLQKIFGARVALVHGRMNAVEKDAAMAAFAAGEIAVLVATTVIEVGVDAPGATLIVIEEAERFGLAALHQLRGRVGRGSQASTCLLLRGAQIGAVARARLALLRETNDGFRIAEEDLRLRGAGEILGTKQSGEARLRLADARWLERLLPLAHEDARALMAADPDLTSPRGKAAVILLYLFERDQAMATLHSG